MESILAESRYAARVLLRTPGFTIVALITLGLGIGATTAVFSMADAVLFRSLPFGDPERAVMIWETNSHIQDGDKLPVANADFLDWRSQNHVFESMAAFSPFSFSLSDVNPPIKLDGVLCSADFFSAIGVLPTKGRGFREHEDEIGNNHVVVISDGLWRRQFGAGPNILGRDLTLTGQKYKVIGIMPPGFGFPEASTMPSWLDLPVQSEVWVPLTFDPEEAKDRSILSRAVIARLRPGISRERAQSDMTNIEANIDRDFRKSQGFGVRVMDLQEQIVGDVRFAFLVPLVAAGAVLLIACSNVANLLLVRFSGRQKEFALRTALGISRARLIRQMLIESLLLAILGGVVGLILAKIGINTVLAMSANYIPRSNEIGINMGVIAFTLIVTLLTGMVSGLVPAIQTSGMDPNNALKEEPRGMASGKSGRKSDNLLVVAEFSLTLTLVIAASLLIKSFIHLQEVNLGLDPENLLTMRMALPTYKYQNHSQRVQFFKQALQQISSLPGVESAGITTSLPLSGTGANVTVDIAGRPVASVDDKPKADYFLATPGYFNTLRIPLLRGRMFTDQDNDKSPPVAIINNAMAESFWPHQNPVGQQISTALEGDTVKREIVGIIGDVRHESLDTSPQPGLWVPYAQNSFQLVFLAMRTKAAPLSLASAIRDEIQRVDKEQPVYDVKSMTQVIKDSSARRSFNMLLLTVSAGMALILAVVGIYSVTASSVTRRTHEIGIRLALGAQKGDILKLVLRQGVILILIGTTIGVVSAFSVSHVISSLLYQISATDPFIFLGAILILASIAILAVYIPARRAIKLDPMMALRQE